MLEYESPVEKQHRRRRKHKRQEDEGPSAPPLRNEPEVHIQLILKMSSIPVDCNAAVLGRGEISDDCLVDYHLLDLLVEYSDPALGVSVGSHWVVYVLFQEGNCRSLCWKVLSSGDFFRGLCSVDLRYVDFHDADDGLGGVSVQFVH